jgi:hypothetical protein
MITTELGPSMWRGFVARKTLLCIATISALELINFCIFQLLGVFSKIHPFLHLEIAQDIRIMIFIAH